MRQEGVGPRHPHRGDKNEGPGDLFGPGRKNEGIASKDAMPAAAVRLAKLETLAARLPPPREEELARRANDLAAEGCAGAQAGR